MPHWIKPNARSESPSHAIWFSAVMRPGQVTGNQTEMEFEYITMVRGQKDIHSGSWSEAHVHVPSAKSFWQMIDLWTLEKTKTYLICDSPNLHLPMIQAFTESNAQGWTLTLAILPPAPTICRWRKGKKSITLLGRSNIWPAPFAETWTGESAPQNGERNGASAPDFCEKQNDAKLKTLIEKTIAWWRFLKQNDLGGFSPTSGSQSLRVWRHKYMTHRVLIDCHDDALALGRSAIYGARCEVLRKTVHPSPIYELDCNGSYGGIMRDMRVPVRLISYRRHCSIRDVGEWLREYVCVARVEVGTDECVFPVHSDARLAFASGLFTTVLAGEELEYAIAHQLVSEVLECAVYECYPAFEAYMSALWNLRQFSASVGNMDDAEHYKLLQNAFWGRWAQKGRVWEKQWDTVDLSIRSWTDINADTKVVTEWRQFGGIVQKLNDEAESRESHPAIAACILAGGRMQLWRWMQKAGLEHVYYVDTDALFVDAVGCERLRADTQPGVLGKLKIKGVYDRVSFYGPKHIRVDGESRYAGMSKVGLDADKGVSTQRQSEHVSQQIRRGRELKASTKEVRKEAKE